MALKHWIWHKNLWINDTLYHMHYISLKIIMKIIMIVQLLPTNTSTLYISLAILIVQFNTTYKYKYISLAILIFIDLHVTSWYLSKNMWGKHTWLLIQLRHTNGRWWKPHVICRRTGNEGCHWWSPRLQVQHQSLQQRR